MCYGMGGSLDNSFGASRRGKSGHFPDESRDKKVAANSRQQRCRGASSDVAV